MTTDPISSESVGKSKWLKLLVAICFGVILASTVYVGSVAYRTIGVGNDIIFWNEEYGPVAREATEAAVAIACTQDSPFPNMSVKSAGSGFVIDAAGFIVTNEHVIHGAREIRVTFSDRRTFLADVVSADVRSDLAVLRIEAGGLAALPLVPAKSLELGQIVIALGNPLGSGSDGRAVATFGQINGLKRRLGGALDKNNDRFYDNLIQTNAVTQPGSSGGPLIDVQGRVIGINTVMGMAVVSAQIFGFALTLTDETVADIERLKSGKPIDHAFLGVDTVLVGEASRRRLGLGDLSGALVETCLVGSPAHCAGIRRGDVITAVESQSVHSPQDLLAILSRGIPGRTVAIELYGNRGDHRAAGSRSIKATLARRTRVDLKGYVEEAGRQSLFVEPWGLELKPLTAWRRDNMNLGRSQAGVFVYEVARGSPADRHGIKPGQVIVQIAQTQIENLQQMGRLAKKYPVMPRITCLEAQPSPNWIDPLE